MKISMEPLQTMSCYPEAFKPYKKLTEQEIYLFDQIKPPRKLPPELEFIKFELDMKKGRHDINLVGKEFNNLDINEQKQLVLEYVCKLFPGFNFEYSTCFEDLSFDTRWSFYMQTMVDNTQVDTLIFIDFFGEYGDVIIN
jgi:hypothetical protein